MRTHTGLLHSTAIAALLSLALFALSLPFTAGAQQQTEAGVPSVQAEQPSGQVAEQPSEQEAEQATDPDADDPRLGVPTQNWRRARVEERTMVDTTATQGIWRGWFELPNGNELGFNFEIDLRRDHFRNPIYSLTLVNGTERIPATLAPIGEEGKPRYELDMFFEGTDASIRAGWTSGGLKVIGEYIYTRDTDGVPVEYRLPFAAINGDGRRFDLPVPLEPDPRAELADTWRVTFESREGPAIMSLQMMPDGRHVQGTVFTPTGDDGVLAGTYHGGRLRLTRFTGGTGLLYEATLQEDDSLVGTFQSLAHHTESFTAVPAKDAALPDLFGLTAWNDTVSPADLAFRDVDGVERSLPDVAPFPAIVYVFGTWCHNCSDATRYLGELRKHHGSDLGMVGVAFETPSEFDEQADRVRAYAEKKDIDFPLLIAGHRDKSSATDVFEGLDRVRAYPTFAFINASGEVTAVHQGFIGPAAPVRHSELRAAFDEQIEHLLAGG